MKADDKRGYHVASAHAAMRYGGNGITFSKIAADIGSTANLGQDDSDSGLFAFRPSR